MPLYLKGCMDLDRYFEDLIDRERMVERFIRSRGLEDLKAEIGEALGQHAVKLPVVFTRRMIRSTMRNLEIVHEFHQWFAGRRDAGTLETMMDRFIDRIGFPNLIT